MALRALPAVMIVMLGLAGTATLAHAQFYRPFRPLLPPPVAVEEDEDDLDDVQGAIQPPPGVQGPYPLPPQGEGPVLYDRFGRRIVESYPPEQPQGYPPRQNYPQQGYPQQAYPSQQQPQGPTVLAPPGFVYPDEERRRLPGLYSNPGDVARVPQQPPGVIQQQPQPPGDGALRPPGVIGAPTTIGPHTPADPRGYAALPPEDQPEEGAPKELPPHLKRQMVDYVTKEPVGTIVIDTQNTYLYLVLGNGKAMRYGIGVGREGFTWSGAERVSKMAEWPDWHPPAEMIERQPYLPRFMAGGLGNPLGARALYLGKTLYRIHGTNQPSTIGTFVSSGCIRLTNADIEDLYTRVKVGTRVVVLPGPPPAATASAAPVPGTEGPDGPPPVNLTPQVR